jgi:phosphotransferase system  glucose/maltose/N-acetylglucosamine-specific IIC component
VTLKPVWNSSTFLQYAGMLIVLVAVGWLLSYLQDAHGTGGLVGWAVLFMAVAVGVALAAERRGEPILAGLLALVALSSSCSPRSPPSGGSVIR